MNENKLGSILLTIGALIMIGLIVGFFWWHGGLLGALFAIAMFCMFIGAFL